MGYDRLIAGYLAHAEAVAYDRPDTHFWAYLLLHRVVDKKPEKAWPWVLAVVTRTADPVILNYVASDILEDILCAHPHGLVDRVEALARTDEHFRKALADVLGSNRMPADVRARLDLAVGACASKSEDAG
jgi:hypothetical protein